MSTGALIVIGCLLVGAVSGFAMWARDRGASRAADARRRLTRDAAPGRAAGATARGAAPPPGRRRPAPPAPRPRSRVRAAPPRESRVRRVGETPRQRPPRLPGDRRITGGPKANPDAICVLCTKPIRDCPGH